MKKWVIWVTAAVLFFVLCRTPVYWPVFQWDKKQYETDTFYCVIKEEYQENDNGERVLQNEFSDIRDGDILVTDSVYCFCFRHGHAALVVDAKQGITLEAFGIGTKSDFAELQAWKRYPHVKVLRLKAPEEVRKKISFYAMEHLAGVPYKLSPGMVDDKDMKENYWGTQCAHLVWAAYQAFGFDIDGNGGWLVLPADFITSEYLYLVPQE